MRRHAFKLALGLCMVVLFASPPPKHVPPSPPVPVQPIQVTLPDSWSVLGDVIRDQGRWFESAASAAAPVSLPKRVTRRSSSEIEACIRARENGGSYARGNNPTHTGMFQFSYSTWVANGGNPETWENASPEEQEQVFATTVARNGYRDWQRYDGC